MYRYNAASARRPQLAIASLGEVARGCARSARGGSTDANASTVGGISRRPGCTGATFLSDPPHRLEPPASTLTYRSSASSASEQTAQLISSSRRLGDSDDPPRPIRRQQPPVTKCVEDDIVAAWCRSWAGTWPASLAVALLLLSVGPPGRTRTRSTDQHHRFQHDSPSTHLKLLSLFLPRPGTSLVSGTAQ